MYDVPDQCPTCGGRLRIRELSCSTCQTEIRGQWQPGFLHSLTGEQVTFLTLFVRSRGNLSEVERNLGVSYPTVRAKLEELIDVFERSAPAMASEPIDQPVERIREEILELVARGEISVDDGLARILSLEDSQ